MEKLTEDELSILNNIRAKRMLRMEDTFNLNHFGSDAIDGYSPNLKKGSLALRANAPGEGRDKLDAPVVDLLTMVKEADPVKEPIPAY